jgi:hypothetical protein
MLILIFRGWVIYLLSTSQGLFKNNFIITTALWHAYCCVLSFKVRNLCLKAINHMLKTTQGGSGKVKVDFSDWPDLTFSNKASTSSLLFISQDLPKLPFHCVSPFHQHCSYCILIMCISVFSTVLWTN